MTDSLSHLSEYSLLELFRMEVETHATLLNENLLAFETQFRDTTTPNPVEASPLLTSLMRAAHCIKGAARTVQLEIAVQLAHVIEDCFQAAMDQQLQLTTTHMDALLNGVDVFLQMIQLEESQLTDWITSAEPEIQATIQTIVDLSQASTPPSQLRPTEPDPAQGDRPTDNPDIDQPHHMPPQHPIAAQYNALTLLPNIETPTDAIVERDAAVTSANQPVIEPVQDKSIPDHSVIANVDSQSPQPPINNKSDRFVRVSSQNLYQLMGLAGESLVAANWLEPFADSFSQLKKDQLQLARLLHQLQKQVSLTPAAKDLNDSIKQLQRREQACRESLNQRQNELEIFARRSANLSYRLYREVVAAHMCPFEEGVKGFPRLVRDLSRKLNKQVKLEIVGQSTPVDRDILKKLEAPLLHILNNALDHGIESPGERLALGKPAEGKIRIEATHRSGLLLITISDDGRGIAMEHLQALIIRKKLVNPTLASQLSQQELMEFLFLPGFSTNGQVTEISGRGVGLNIAKNMAQDVGGQLQITSQTGHGLTLHFQLPLTLSVLRTLLVEVAGEPYAFPLAQIDKILCLEQSEIYWTDQCPYIHYQERNITLISAEQLFEISTTPQLPSPCCIIIINESRSNYGIIVDQFLGERDLVVRPLDSSLGKIQHISAAALMEDGSPVLIVDIAELLHSIEQYHSKRSAEATLDSSALNPLQVRSLNKRILVIDDSATVRDMERRLLEKEGYLVDVATDGWEGWHAARNGNYDLIVSDVDMPRLDGFSLVEKIRQHSRLNATPIILVTCKDTPQERSRGLLIGANYYLSKTSFHDHSLITAVLELMSP